jgi:predicted permease
VSSLWQDIRYGLRMLAKNPGFTLVAVLTLGLGIGANTALFSVVNGVLLNPLPFPHPEQLVRLHESKPNFAKGSISYPNFRDWQRDNRSFSAVAVSRGTAFSLTGVREAQRVTGQFITSDFFPLLGVNPLLGRNFAAREDEIGGPPLVMISAGFWKEKLGGAPDVCGKALMLDGTSYTIIGVVPETFQFAVGGFMPSDVYVPIGQWTNPLLNSRSAGLGIHGFARLKPGVTLEQAQADLDALTRHLAAVYPETNRGIGANVTPLRQEMLGKIEPFLLVLMGAVGFVLLIACGNVANLMLARATDRTREFAVRVALGASRARVVRQLLAESVLLSLAGGALGLLLAQWGTQAGLKLIPSGLPRANEVAVDGRVLLFTLAISLAAGVLFGLFPALRVSKAGVQETLQESGRGGSGVRQRAHGIFVMAEMALALVLLCGAGLMLRTLQRLWSVDPGFQPRGVLTFGAAFSPSLANASPSAIRATMREFDSRLAAVPGVEGISLSWGAVPFYSDDEQLFWLEGQPKPSSKNEMSWTLSYVVEPDYLKIMGIPLLRGRFLTPQDDERAPRVAVVDEVFARKYFPNEDPIGKHINLDEEAAVPGPATIVGVVGHVKQWGLDTDDSHQLRAQMYSPFMQLWDKAIALAVPGTSVLVRSNLPPQTLFDALRRASSQMSSEQVIYGPQTMEDLISSSVAARQFTMELLGIFALLALTLACVGIYGVMSYLVGQRTREIGIRLALGAQTSDVLRAVLGQGAKLALAGVGLGLFAALGLTQLLTRFSLLFGVSAADPSTFSAVAVLLTLVALLACWIPARRATRVDPLVALRYE